MPTSPSFTNALTCSTSHKYGVPIPHDEVALRRVELKYRIIYAGEIHEPHCVRNLCTSTHPCWCCFCGGLGLVCRVAGASGCAHRVEPGWCGRCLSCSLCPCTAVRRTGRHRRTLPICLHTGAEHDPPQSYLRHAAGSARLPRPAMVLPSHRLYDACAGGHPYRHRLLSSRCTCLDQKTGRADAEGHLPLGVESLRLFIRAVSNLPL